MKGTFLFSFLLLGFSPASLQAYFWKVEAEPAPAWNKAVVSDVSLGGYTKDQIAQGSYLPAGWGFSLAAGSNLAEYSNFFVEMAFSGQDVHYPGGNFGSLGNWDVFLGATLAPKGFRTFTPYASLGLGFRALYFSADPSFTELANANLPSGQFSWAAEGTLGLEITLTPTWALDFAFRSVLPNQMDLSNAGQDSPNPVMDLKFSQAPWVLRGGILCYL